MVGVFGADTLYAPYQLGKIWSIGHKSLDVTEKLANVQKVSNKIVSKDLVFSRNKRPFNRYYNNKINKAKPFLS